MKLPHQVHRALGTVKVTPAHVRRVRAAQAREREKLHARSPKWPAVRRRHLKLHPACAACGGRRGVQVHHVEPFHLRPGRELDLTNLISLCATVGGLDCHELLGHGDNWKCYNPAVREHAAAALADPTVAGLTTWRNAARKARLK